jgi:hypothetical protein
MVLAIHMEMDGECRRERAHIVGHVSSSLREGAERSAAALAALQTSHGREASAGDAATVLAFCGG